MAAIRSRSVVACATCITAVGDVPVILVKPVDEQSQAAPSGIRQCIDGFVRSVDEPSIKCVAVGTQLGIGPTYPLTT